MKAWRILGIGLGAALAGCAPAMVGPSHATSAPGTAPSAPTNRSPERVVTSDSPSPPQRQPPQVIVFVPAADDEARSVVREAEQARAWLAEPLDVSPLPGGGDPLNGQLWADDEQDEPARPAAAVAPAAAPTPTAAAPAGAGKPTALPAAAVAAPASAAPAAAGPAALTVPEPKTGRLPPEIVQHIVRKNMGRFRGCYAGGLLRNPELQGRVTTRFVIHHDGRVSEASDEGSTLPDPEVLQCIVAAFRRLTFPRPEGGVVIVTYPLRLTPRPKG